MAIEYSNINSLIDGFNKVMSFQTKNSPNNVPTPLILFGAKNRSGLSAIEIASNIIQRKKDAGLPIGALPSGNISPDEIMERIRVEEILKALFEKSIITVAIPTGIPLQASGISADGTPVTVYGRTVGLARGYGIIQ